MLQNNGRGRILRKRDYAAGATDIWDNIGGVAFIKNTATPADMSF